MATAPDQYVWNQQQVSTAPLNVTVPGSLEIALQTVTAVFNGVSASGSFLPALQIISDGGIVLATFVDSSSPVAAGGSAEVTFGTFLRKSGGGCCNTASSGSYAAFALSTSPNAAWPFNETVGTSALDATGHGHTLGYFAPFSLAQPAGPPGTVAVQYPQSGSPGGRAATGGGGIPAYTSNFAAGLWVRVLNSSSLLATLMGQGVAVHGPSGTSWELVWNNGTGKFELYLAAGTLGMRSDAIYGIPDGLGSYSGDGLWHFVGIQNNAGTWQMYVDGALQSTTSATVITGVAGVWFAQDGFGGSTFYLAGQTSWGFMWSRPLTPGEWAGLASPNGAIPAGWFLQSTGGGGSTYAPISSGTATAGYRLTADGNGGTYWAP